MSNEVIIPIKILEETPYDILFLQVEDGFI